MKFIFKYILLLAAFSTINTVYAVEIVRLNLEYGDPAVPHTLDLELFDDVTPLTTNNFLNYVNSGKYDDSFFTRSVPGFIIQTGGYTFTPVDPDVNFLHPEDTPPVKVLDEPSSPVKNEYPLTTITNIRGTISMAKLSHNPDSASSEWFINLADNRDNLDNQNGGFTVFGQIIDDGMSLADEISLAGQVPVAGDVLGSAFSNLPQFGWVLGEPIYKKNLIMITSTVTIDRPILRYSPDREIFPLDLAGDSTGNLQVITLTNTGTEALTIAPIVDTLPAQFVIESDNCSNITLDIISIVPGASCDLEIRFTADSATTFSGSLNIEYSSVPSPSNYNVTLELIAEGAPTNAVINSSITDLFFSPTDQGASETKDIIILNKGGNNLTINSITTDQSDYSVEATGCMTGTTLALGETCTLSVTFTPSTIDTITGNLNILSTGGDLNIPITGDGFDPEIKLPASIDLGTEITGEITVPVVIENIALQDTFGRSQLELGTFTFSGPDAELFTLTTDCPSTFLRAGSTCNVFITLTPINEGILSASLIIESNDALNPNAIIPIIGSVGKLQLSDTSILFSDKPVDGTTDNKVLSVQNIGPGTITINSISITNNDENVFSIDNMGCSDGSTLGDCDLTVSFTPDEDGLFTANLIIQTTFTDIDIPLTGKGLAPKISAAQVLDIGTTQIDGLISRRNYTISNIGSEDLIITNVQITGTDKDEFDIALTNTNAPCTDNLSNDIVLNSFFQCQITITLETLTSNGGVNGDKQATLEFSTNDPNNPVFYVDLTGTSDNDADGISSAIEQLAPNGDGNNDGISDDIQNNVASFFAGTGTLMTMISENATVVLNSGEISDSKPTTALLDININDIPIEFPSNQTFNLGAYSFRVQVTDSLPTDTGLIYVTVGIFIPENIKVEKYYRFGPTPDNPSPHLYDFTYDNSTGLGARILGPSTYGGLKKNIILVTYVDGGLGDDDLTVNGVIENSSGGFSIGKDFSNDDSSGSLSSLYMMIFAISLLFFRTGSHKYYGCRGR